MNKLYPPIKPYKIGKLKVSKLHTLYFEEAGNPKGLPIVYLHGGPGSQIQALHRRYFNPRKYRIILFNQRGCGKSTPLGELKENTTKNLIEDIEKIREHLEIKKWNVYGSSWGSTLALTYAEKHPNKIGALIVSGIFTFTKWELAWLHNEGSQIFYPDAWEIYSRNINKGQTNNLLNIFYRKIFSNNKKLRDKAIKDFYYWDGFRMDLIPNTKYKKNKLSNIDIASAKIYFHYAKNNGFLEENQLIKNATKIKNIPGVILQGRYDMVCPPITAWSLHKAWPKANFHIIEASGHRSAEINKIDKIIYYTNKFQNMNIKTPKVLNPTKINTKDFKK